MSRRTPPSLVSSLIRAALLWAVPGLILVTIALGLISRNSSYRGFEEPLESAVLGIIANVEASEDGTLRLSRELPEPRYQRALSGRYWLIGTVENGSAIAHLISSRSLACICTIRPKRSRLPFTGLYTVSPVFTTPE